MNSGGRILARENPIRFGLIRIQSIEIFVRAPTGFTAVKHNIEVDHAKSDRPSFLFLLQPHTSVPEGAGGEKKSQEIEIPQLKLEKQSSPSVNVSCRVSYSHLKGSGISTTDSKYSA
jgi:hypothetical protein